MIEKFFSYIIQVNVFKQKSEVNKNLEVTCINGKLVLDSKVTKHSNGSLQRILRISLQHIGFNKIKIM